MANWRHCPEIAAHLVEACGRDVRRVGELKRLHYPLEVMLICVRWYAAYPLSLRHIEEMMAERGRRFKARTPQRADIVSTHERHTLRSMQIRTRVCNSVPADVSEFARAELEAFVALNRRRRPAAWALVEQLQRVCEVESPKTAAGYERSRHDGHANALSAMFTTG